jgi:phytoene synthase
MIAVMESQPADGIPPEVELALSWSRRGVRNSLAIALRLDRRLARIVARTSEPMLGQMRLAWWREALAKPAGDRPRGDAVLDGVANHWAGREAALAAMVDGWEVLVTAERLGPNEADILGSGRGAFFAALAPEASPAQARRLVAAGRCWALADAAARVADTDERAVLVAAGLAAQETGARFPPGLRGLAVLEGLALRALRRGGRPLMEGRGASLAALRAAIFRR